MHISFSRDQIEQFLAQLHRRVEDTHHKGYAKNKNKIVSRPLNSYMKVEIEVPTVLKKGVARERGEVRGGLGHLDDRAGIWRKQKKNAAKCFA